MTRVVGLGAGGHAKVLIEILRLEGKFDIVGLLDPGKIGQIVAGVPILGSDENMEQLRAQGIELAFIGVGGIGDNTLRIKLYKEAILAGFNILNILHPTAILGSSVQLGHGVSIMAGVIINVDSCFGDNVIINTGAVVEHDCMIEAHVHISSGATLCGGVHVGEASHIGAGATIRQCLQIGKEAIVGAGAVVVEDVPPFAVVVGVPAKVIKHTNH